MSPADGTAPAPVGQNRPGSVCGRFAPTPSGRMHLGNLYCALIAWLAARSAGGRMVLRIEDLDAMRCPRALADQMERELLWLGLSWEEGGSAGGPAGSYYQSERTPIYEVYFRRLEGKGLVYPCFCSRAELHADQAPHLTDGRVVYGGRCARLTPAQVEALRKRRSPAARLRVPAETVSFVDGLAGPYAQPLQEECGDFIIRRSDGVFAYQLAVVVDDGLMGVTQVVRGRDLLDSTPRQLYLYRLLELPPPRFYHLPLLLDPLGRRLSKRDGDVDLTGLRQRFGAPERLIGYLGWLCGLLERPQALSARELLPYFSWEKLPKQDILLPASFYETTPATVP